jgi:hypothetical protein
VNGKKLNHVYQYCLQFRVMCYYYWYAFILLVSTAIGYTSIIVKADCSLVSGSEYRTN